MTSSGLDGKLELLFAYLSINNVRHIQPLLLGAVDEYQTMKDNMTYEEKKSINLIKSLLWHAERGEWTEAMSHLNGAQQAYQEYISRNTATADGKTQGYKELHGKSNSYTNIYKNTKRAPNDYMFRNSQFDPFEARLKNQTSDRPRYTTNQKFPARMWSARSTRSGLEEQGPTAPKPRRSSMDNGASEVSEKIPEYPGFYANQNKAKVETLSLKHATEVMKVDSSRSGVPNDDVNSSPSERQLTSVRQQSGDTTPKIMDDDVNRPSKIADSFTSLYTEQWTKALESLKTVFVREENAIEYLFDIITESYKLCSEESQTQVLEFEKAALNILTNGKYSQDEKERVEKKGDVKLMIKYRKEVADLSVKRLQDIFLTQTLPVINRRHDVKQNDVVDVYVRECIDVCWRMVIQDPPIHLVESRDIDKVYFDSRLYKPFTKPGTRVKYFVWPILQIYEGGPILAKGIAQGDNI